MRTALILTLLLALSSQVSFAQLKTPSPSPSAEIKQTVGITDIHVSYSRPGVKGRAGKIWGGLVPFGEVWRTGANATTTIEFSTDVTIAGKDVKAGKYGLFTLPTPEDADWLFILSSKWQGNIGGYDPKLDLFRVNVPVKDAPMTEWFTFHINLVSETEAHLIWRWEEKEMVIPVTVKTPELVEAGINSNLQQGRNSYFQAANYYLGAGAYDKAIEYADTGLQLGANAYGLWVKSRAQAAKGDTKAAIETAKASITQAKAENGPNSAFFISDNEKNIAEWSK